MNNRNWRIVSLCLYVYIARKQQPERSQKRIVIPIPKPWRKEGHTRKKGLKDSRADTTLLYTSYAFFPSSLLFISSHFSLSLASLPLFGPKKTMEWQKTSKGEIDEKLQRYSTTLWVTLSRPPPTRIVYRVMSLHTVVLRWGDWERKRECMCALCVYLSFLLYIYIYIYTFFSFSSL